MFLTKRNGIYYLNYLDSSIRRYRRVSTFTSNQRDAFLYLESFSDQSSVSDKLKEVKLTEFKKEYIDYLKNTHSPKYISSIELSFNKIMECLGNIRLDELNTRNLEKFISTTFSRTQSSAGLYYRTLKAAFNKAVNWEYIKINPLSKVRLPKMQKKSPLFISPSEFRLIIEKTESELMQNIFTLAFHTGMRLGEIVNMKWNWINLFDRAITIKISDQFTTKSKRERLIPMNSIVYNLFAKNAEKFIDDSFNKYVFRLKYSIRLNEDYVSKNFKKIIRKTNLNTDIHFHTLRHSFASNLIQKGANLYAIKELLGHEDIKTTQIYSHLTQKNLLETVNLLE